MQDALLNLKEITVPEIIEIDEAIYDKLYPRILSTPTNSDNERIRTIRKPFPPSPAFSKSEIPADDKIVDYDVDWSDELWISEQPKQWNLSVDAFEEVFEFLELHSDQRVPSLDELIAQRIPQLKEAALTALYDYWLDKRLKEKSRLMSAVKTKDKKLKAKNAQEDPYVAFRQCQEKMHLRKNRDSDHKSYVKMLQLRAGLAAVTKRLQVEAQAASVKRDMLRLKLAIFEAQYRSGRWCDDFLEHREVHSDVVTHQTVKDERYEENPGTDDITEVFPFLPQPDCEYFEVNLRLLPRF